jgi:nickel-dependent lactate racemase|tara:strand:- start:48 stop:1319 length:1272 start_codon:yes stop_codon:yes gene_type:complete
VRIDLAYGEGRLPIECPDGQVTVIEPLHTPGLPDEKAAILEALMFPDKSPPLREMVKPDMRICILFTDITRATPNHRIIPWLLEYLADLPPGNITLLNQTGTHRGNTRAELEKMLTPEVVSKYKVLNHDCKNDADLVQLGKTRNGTPAMLNRHAVEADLRIITGFIEPHLFAGFSGGPKGIMPGVAGLKTVMCNHGAKNIGNQNATFGITADNPIWEEMLEIAMRTGPKFLLNVTLNEQRKLTGVFAGDLLKAHQAGCQYVRESAMQEVAEPFDIVVTTNSGYPLDLNLYQGVKGMSAGARIVKKDGILILACECREGVPAKSPMDKLLRSTASSEEILAILATPGFVRPEQWQAQIQSLIQRQAHILVHSSLEESTVREAHLEPCVDISETVRHLLGRMGPDARVAVLPQGPLTIPYLATSV